MSRYTSILAFVFTILGVGALAVAGFLFWQRSHAPEPPKPSVNIEDAERTLNINVGKPCEVEFHLVNDGSEARRVIGMHLDEETARSFKPEQKDPFEIPAKGSAVLKFTLQLRVPGPFEYTVPIYLDDAGFREMTIKVKGEAAKRSAASK